MWLGPLQVPLETRLGGDSRAKGKPVLRLDAVPLEETIPSIIDLVRRLDAEVLIQVSLDRKGNVIDVECLVSHVAPKNGI